jgi:hypothetical protein
MLSFSFSNVIHDNTTASYLQFDCFDRHLCTKARFVVEEMFEVPKLKNLFQ